MKLKRFYSIEVFEVNVSKINFVLLDCSFFTFSKFYNNLILYYPIS